MAYYACTLEKVDLFVFVTVTSLEAMQCVEVEAEVLFASTETVGLLGTGAHDFHTAPEL